MARTYAGFGRYGQYGSSNIFQNAGCLRSWFENVDTEPIVIIQMGDSNLLKASGGGGFSGTPTVSIRGGANSFEKLCEDLDADFGIGVFGTGIVSPSSGAGNGASLGYHWSDTSSSLGGTGNTKTGCSVAVSSGGVSIVTKTAHGFTTGQIVTVSASTTTPNIDGSYVVTVTGVNTFTLPLTEVTGSGTATCVYSNYGYLDGVETGNFAGVWANYWSVPHKWSRTWSGKPGNYSPHYPGALANTVGTTSLTNFNHGLQILSSHPMITRGDNLKFLYKYGTFASGGGAFQISIRRQDNPYNSILRSGTINSTGGDAMANGEFAFAASNNPSKYGVHMRLSWDGVTNVTSKFYTAFMQCVSTTRTGGVSCHVLSGMGGQSCFDYANFLGEMGTTKIANFIAEAIRGKTTCNSGSPVKVIFRINGGVNDSSETGDADNAQPNSSASGYADNIIRIQDALGTAMYALGYTSDNYRFWVEVSHRYADDAGDAVQTKLDSYRGAGFDFLMDPGVNPNKLQTMTVDLCALHTELEFSLASHVGAGYNFSYSSAVTWTYDKYHLQTAGHQTVYERLFGTLLGEDPPVRPTTSLINGPLTDIIQLWGPDELY